MSQFELCSNHSLFDALRHPSSCLLSIPVIILHCSDLNRSLASRSKPTYSITTGLFFSFLSLLIFAFNLQVPTKYFFDCTGRCKHNLSKKGGWMKERSFCIEFLTRIYGYLPLLYTTSRADPVAAETPSVKEYGKCFKPT